MRFHEMTKTSKKTERCRLNFMRMRAFIKTLSAMLVLSMFSCAASKQEDFYKKGEEAYSRKNYEAAAEYFTKAIEATSATPRLYVRRGLAYGVLEDHELAADNFEKATKINLDDADSMLYIGIAYFLLQNPDEALRTFNAALKKYPNNWEILNAIGDVYHIQLNQDQTAIDYYSKAIENYKYNSDAITTLSIIYYSRGICYSKNKDIDNAISDFTIAIKHDDEEELYYINRGRAFAINLMNDEAIKDYSKALDLNPLNATVFMYRGMIYFDTENYDKSISDFSKAIESNPNQVMAYAHRGNAYLSAGEYDKAIEDYNKAIDLYPSLVDLYFNISNAYERKGDYVLATEFYKKAVELTKRETNPTTEKQLSILMQKANNKIQTLWRSSDKYDFSMQFEKGNTYYFELVGKQTIKLPTDSSEKTFVGNEYRYKQKWNILDITNSNYKVHITTYDVDVQNHFNSDNQQFTKSSASLMDKFDRTEMDIVMTPRGEILEVTMSENVLSPLVETLDMDENSLPFINKLSNHMPQETKEQFSQLLEFVPENISYIGNKWVNKFEFTLMNKDVIPYALRYEYESVDLIGEKKFANISYYGYREFDNGIEMLKQVDQSTFPGMSDYSSMKILDFLFWGTVSYDINERLFNKIEQRITSTISISPKDEDASYRMKIETEYTFSRIDD